MCYTIFTTRFNKIDEERKLLMNMVAYPNQESVRSISAAMVNVLLAFAGVYFAKVIPVVALHYGGFFLNFLMLALFIVPIILQMIEDEYPTMWPLFDLLPAAVLFFLGGGYVFINFLKAGTSDGIPVAISMLSVIGG